MGEEVSAPGLFGWPPQPRLDARGRPAHQPTRETTIRVISLLALGRTPKEAASAIGLTVPTLRKHYFSDPRVKAARLTIEGDLLFKLAEEAEKGNVSAIKEFMKRIDKAALAQLPAAMKPPKAPKPGKKQQRHADAIGAHKTTSWGDLVEGAPEDSPPRLN